MRSDSFVVRAIIDLYPAAWRDRYAADAEALVEDLAADGRGSFLVLVDLLRGAVDAHLHPPRSAAPAMVMRARSSASMATMWVLLFPLIVMGLLTLPADADVPGTGAEVTVLHHSIRLAALLAAAGLALALVSLTMTTVAAYRRGDARARGLVRRAVAGGVVFLAAAPVAALVARAINGVGRHGGSALSLIPGGSTLPVPPVLAIGESTRWSTILVYSVATLVQVAAVVAAAVWLRRLLGATDHSAKVLQRAAGMTVASVGILSAAWAVLVFWVVELVLHTSLTEVGPAAGLAGTVGYFGDATGHLAGGASDAISVSIVVLSGLVIFRGVMAAVRWVRAPELLRQKA